MAHSLTEADEFTEDVVVPDDGDSATAASIAGAFQSLANRTKSLKGRADALYENIGLRKIGGSVVYVDEAGDPEMVIGGWVLASYAAQWTSGVSGGSSHLVIDGNSAKLWLPVDRLPAGSMLNTVTVFCKPGTTRLGSARMNLSIEVRNLDDLTTSQFGTTAYDDGTAIAQALQSGDAALVPVDDNAIVATLTAGDTAATYNDEVYAWVITALTPSPV